VFSQLANIWRVHDLRNKLLFVVAMVAVYRMGVFIRVPGVDPIAIEQLRESAGQQGALGFLNLFSGGAFESFSIFALGIMPYITASIIMQVLGVVIPKLEELQQEGAVGQRKITQYTRYVTIGLATLQATGLVFIFGTGRGTAFFSAASAAPTVPLLPDGVWPRGYLIIPTLVAGTAVLMWMAELISQRGIGNGMSMIIFASVVASLPGGFWSILQLNKVFWFVAMILLTLGIIVAVVYVELGQRRIPVQFAKRVVGRRMMGGQNTYIPLKVNQSGVIPIIFASSILLLPVIFSQFLGSGEGWRGEIAQFVDRYIVNPQNFVYITIFSLMIIAFAYFYNSIAFDPVRQADQLR
jgi:preprotein translocase subunit SecY